MRLVRVPKGVEKVLIGALLIAAFAWGFLYNHVLEDEPQPMRLQPSAQFSSGNFASPPIAIQWLHLKSLQ
jgi:hypothetical protein